MAVLIGYLLPYSEHSRTSVGVLTNLQLYVMVLHHQSVPFDGSFIYLLYM
jgi:hypothetical protein